MGNYLPKSLEFCSTDDLIQALQRMGPSYAAYSHSLQEQGLSGSGLSQLRSSSQYEDLCNSLGIHNRLHRVVLIAKLKTARLERTESNSYSSADTDAHSSPEALVRFLNDMGPDYFRYIQAVRENCLCMDILGKLKLDQWKIVFQGIGVEDIMEQNILYNKIMDQYHHAATNVRAKKRKSLDPSPPHSSTTNDNDNESTKATQTKATKSYHSCNHHPSPVPTTRQSAQSPTSSEAMKI